MTPSGFTFVNTIGAPGLTKAAAKRVRGHVTRANFAARRAQKAQADNQSNEVNMPLSSKRSQGDSKVADQGLPSDLELIVALSVATSRTDPERAAVLCSCYPAPQPDTYAVC